MHLLALVDLFGIEVVERPPRGRNLEQVEILRVGIADPRHFRPCFPSLGLKVFRPGFHQRPPLLEQVASRVGGGDGSRIGAHGQEAAGHRESGTGPMPAAVVELPVEGASAEVVRTNAWQARQLLARSVWPTLRTRRRRRCR